MSKFTGKIFISGKIQVVTGLRIGGSKAGLNIGDIDLNVIKNAEGVPFIPGSSLKGKLRSVLAREEDSAFAEVDSLMIKLIFGIQTRKVDNREIPGIPTRIIVRDAYFDMVEFSKKKEKEFSELELDWTETKWENKIDRKTGAAERGGLRQLERVPAGVLFDFEIIYNVFDDNEKDKHLTAIRKAMRLLEDDYLGGQGSRGYGKIKFINVKIEEKTIEAYEKENQRVLVEDLAEKGI